MKCVVKVERGGTQKACWKDVRCVYEDFVECVSRLFRLNAKGEWGKGKAIL